MLADFEEFIDTKRSTVYCFLLCDNPLSGENYNCYYEYKNTGLTSSRNTDKISLLISIRQGKEGIRTIK